MLTTEQLATIVEREKRARKEAEALLEQKSSELYESNARLIRTNHQLETQATELARARDAALQASKAKSEFLANMSHELRTPLNGVLGMIELALDGSPLTEQRTYLEIAKNSADSLLTVINDILDFSKIEAGKLDLESVAFNLRDRLQSSMKALGVQAFNRGLELTYSVAPEVPEVLLGDPLRLIQVLNNLVTNAVKFTERGEVFVEVSVEARRDGQVCLHCSVHDTGIGLTRQQQIHIWEAFAQADTSTTRRFGGTGLGLTISRRLVEMMGGEMEVESNYGQGSTFHFKVPLEVGDTPKQQSSQIDDLRGLTVLVVDDNSTNRRVLEAQTRALHMLPILAANAEQALRFLNGAVEDNTRLSLALVDARMPETDGFALIQELRANPAFDSLPIILLTSCDQAGDRERCRGLDVATYLIKPVGRSELQTAILRVLGNEPKPQLERRLSQAARAPDRRLRILLAEDNRVNTLIAVRLLEKRGYVVTTAGTGREALDILERHDFDLVLMDVQMPEMDGFDATAAIRHREQTAGGHLPIVAMTAYAMQGDRERCLAAGMDSYISKPFQAEQVFSTIDNVLSDLSQSH